MECPDPTTQTNRGPHGHYPTVPRSLLPSRMPRDSEAGLSGFPVLHTTVVDAVMRERWFDNPQMPAQLRLEAGLNAFLSSAVHPGSHTGFAVTVVRRHLGTNHRVPTIGLYHELQMR